MQKIFLAISIFILVLGACSPNKSAKVYTKSEANQAQVVEEGVVESVEPVIIRQDGTIIGTVGGAVIGGIAGSTVGGGRGQDIATVAGVIIGGALGSLFEQGITEREALKIVVRLDDGQKIAIVQEADVQFYPNERVNILDNYETIRVSKIGSPGF
jgi:outer membrane lipoprotein SlyB